MFVDKGQGTNGAIIIYDPGETDPFAPYLRLIVRPDSGYPENLKWITSGFIGYTINGKSVVAAQAIGTATLSFDCTHGQLAYTFTDGSGRSGSIPLTRLTQNVTCSTGAPSAGNADFAFSGNFYDPATSGQGITVEVNPITQLAFFGWFTYAPGGGGGGVAGQRWYTGQGAFAPGARSIAIQLYETTGGAFNVSSPTPHTDLVGSGTLAYQSCTNATLSYTFSAGSNSGNSGTIHLQRIGPVPPGCVF